MIFVSAADDVNDRVRIRCSGMLMDNSSCGLACIHVAQPCLSSNPEGGVPSHADANATTTADRVQVRR